MDRVVKTKILGGVSGPYPNLMYETGTRLVVYEVRDNNPRWDGYYAYLEGVGLGGNSFETDDFGPFSTIEEAERAVCEFYGCDV